VICDALVTALQAVNFSSLWGYTGAVSISAMSLPQFDLLNAVDTLQIKVAAYPNVDMKRIDRHLVQGDQKIGIALVKKLKVTDGVPDETDFRSLKSLVESMHQWAWSAPASYAGKIVDVGFPAWFDFQKAKGSPAIFLSIINPVYRLGFEP
jgi:hypothetical protein